MKAGNIITLIAAALIAVSCKPKVPVWEVNATLEDGIFTWSNDVVSYSVFVQDPRNDGKPVCGISAKVNDSEGHEISLASGQDLGYGASAPMGISGFYLPDRPCKTAEVVMRTPDQIIIHLGYDVWKIDEAEITLDKQITLTAGSAVMKVIDYYNGPFEKLNIAVGISEDKALSKMVNDHSMICADSNGYTTLVAMPESSSKAESRNGYLLMQHEVTAGEPLYYYIGVSGTGPDSFLDILDTFN